VASRRTGRANERGVLDADANSDMPGNWYAANDRSASRGSGRSDALHHDVELHRRGASSRNKSGRKGRYYRSSDGVLGGVCAGLADYYNADVLPFRLVFVLLAAASLGAFAVVYLICVLVWPKREPSNVSDMYEVRPHRVDSSAYGSLSAADIRKMSTRGRHRRADAPRSVGHIPPIPPRCFVVQYGEIAPFFTQMSAMATAGSGAGLTSGYAAQSPRDHADERRRMSNRAIYLVLAGLFLLTLLIDALAARFVEPSQSMQLLPLFFVLAGVCVLVVPSGRAYVPVRLVDGCALIVGGMFALALSEGALSTGMLANPPIAVTLMALTALVLITLRKRPRWLLVAIGILTLLLAVLAFVVCAQPGPVSRLTITLPLVGSANIWFR
jgi:phage shock protein C